MTPKKTTIPNPLKARDPDLVQQLTMFRHQLADMLLERFASLLNDPHFRLRNELGPLEDISAAAQVVRVLIKDEWSEVDLEAFDAYWRTAFRADFFADQFEADRHKIQLAARTARENLLGKEATPDEPAVRQPTLW